MTSSTDLNVFSDRLWLNREYERELERKEFQESLVDDDFLWGPLPQETQLEIQWDKIGLDAMNIATAKLRSGEPIEARKIVRGCAAPILNVELPGGTYNWQGTTVLPTMIIEYVTRDIEELLMAAGEQ